MSDLSPEGGLKRTSMGMLVSPLGVAASRLSLDDPGRRGKSFDGSNALLEPPAIFGRPVFEFAVEAEIMGPVMGDVRIELGLPADRDEIGLPVRQNCFGLLGFENDADRHRCDADFVLDPLRIRHLETETARDLGCRRRA